MAISVHYSSECLTKWAKWKFDRIWCKHFPIKNSMHLNKTHRICGMYTMHTSSWCMDKWLSVIISFCSLHVRIVQQHKNCSGSFIFHMKKWHFAIRCEMKTTEKLSNWWKSHCVNLCCFVVLEILYRVNANADSYFSLSTVVFFSLPFSVSFSSFSSWFIVYIQKSERKSTIAHEKFKRMENVQFIVANLKTFDDNDSAVNAIFAISNVQMINLTFRRRQKKETNAWRSTEFHKSCRIIIFYSFILKTNIACLHSLFLEWFLFSYFNLSQFDLPILFSLLRIPDFARHSTRFIAIESRRTNR